LDGTSSEFGSHTKTADSLRMPMVVWFSGIFTGSENQRLSKKIDESAEESDGFIGIRNAN